VPSRRDYKTALRFVDWMVAETPQDVGGVLKKSITNKKPRNAQEIDIIKETIVEWCMGGVIPAPRARRLEILWGQFAKQEAA